MPYLIILGLLTSLPPLLKLSTVISLPSELHLLWGNASIPFTNTFVLSCANTITVGSPVPLPNQQSSLLYHPTSLFALLSLPSQQKLTLGRETNGRCTQRSFRPCGIFRPNVELHPMLPIFQILLCHLSFDSYILIGDIHAPILAS